MRFATLYIRDFPVWVIEQLEPALCGHDIIVQQSGRVAARSERLEATGIACGWPIERARAQAPDAIVRAHPGPRTRLAWDLLIEALATRTPWVEPALSGVFITRAAGNGAGALRSPRPGSVTASQALDTSLNEGIAVLAPVDIDPHALARWARASVGVADDRATSFLAALSARPGKACAVPDKEATRFRQRLPLGLLSAAGVSASALERLGWLGFKTLGQLERLSLAQLRAQLPEGEALHALGRTDDRRPVAMHRPAPSVRLEHAEDSPLEEPGAWLPVIDGLVVRAVLQLERQDAQMVRVCLRCGGPWRSARRLSHEPTSDARALSMLARLALRDLTPRFVEGADGFAVVLEGLVPAASRQALLWGNERATLARALAALEQRIPGASMRVADFDADAYLPEEAFHLVSLAPPTPAGRRPPERATPHRRTERSEPSSTRRRRA